MKLAPARPTRRRPGLCVTTLEDRTTPALAFALSGVGLGTANLLAFDTAAPAATTTTAVTNVAAGETLVGIDFRPQNGHLYGLGVNATGSGTLYDISTRTGRATPVGTTGGVTTTTGLPDPAAAGTGFAFDFNPVADAIRVVATDGDNFTVDPNTGATLANQTAADTALGLSGAGYTNNAPNLTATTLYEIGATNDSLYVIPSPGAGAATLVGALGVDVTAVNGFDIPAGVNAATSGTAVTTGSGFAALTVGGVSQLYSVNLVTGAATPVGTIGSGAAVGGLAVQSDSGGLPAIGLSGAAPGAANLVRFSTATPGTTTTQAVTGIDAADTLVGVDFRPATGQLIALGVNATTGNGTLYLIRPQTGAATVIGAVGSVDVAGALPDPAAATTGYGFDFNPTVDLIRVVTTAGQSFSVNPNTGAVGTSAPALNGGTTTADAAAYTNSFGQTTGAGNPTTLYVLDAASDTLYVQNAGTSATTAVAAVTVGGAPLDFTLVNGFDIPAGVTSAAPGGTRAAGFGYATLVVGGAPTLFRINLTTGEATSVGAVGTTLSGLTLGDAPGGVVSFQNATATVDEGAAGVSVTLTRTGGTGPQTVTVTVTGGTATAGTDFTGGPYTVTFPDGATTTSFTIPVTNDTDDEADETVVLTLSAAPGAALGAQKTTTVTITDNDLPPIDRPRTLSVGGSGTGTAVAYVPGASGGYANPPTRTTANTVFPGFTGEVRTASGDFNGDGTEDTVLVTGPGVKTVMAVVSGKDGSVLLGATDPFGDANFTFGGFVTAGDIDKDGRWEWVVTPELRGGPRVVIFRLLADGSFNITSAGQPSLVANFFGIGDPAFRDGDRAALGDVNGDGVLDVFSIAAFNGGPRTALYNGADVLVARAALRDPVKLIGDFFAAPSGQDEGRGGRSIAAGDVNGDGRADLIVTGDNLLGTGNQIVIFSGADLAAGRVPGFGATPLASFVVGGQSPAALVSVATVNADGDNRADLAVGSGPGQASLVKLYLGKDLSGTTEPASTSLDPFGTVTLNGVFVG